MSLVDVKTVAITDRGQIAIPKDVRDNMKLGDKIVMLSYKDHIEIRPLKFMERNLNLLLAAETSLKKDWNSKEEDKAWKNL